MKKQLPMLAVLTAFATPLFAADNPITLYGIMNVNYSYADNGIVKQSKVDNGNTASRIGFKGEEVINGSLKAYFQLETGITPDDAANSGAFGSREAWVALIGDFGKIGLGRGKTPYKDLGDIFDINNGDNDLEIYVDKNGLNGFITGRFNNAIRWDTPKLVGFSGSIMYGAGENKTADAPGKPGVNATQNWSLGARYNDGPLLLAFAYDAESNIGSTPVDGAKNRACLLSGTYKLLDTLTLGASVQNATVETNALRKERNAFDLIALYSWNKFDLRAGALLGGKIKWNNKVAGVSNEVDGTHTLRYTVGAQYNFSKRTGVYIEYNGDNFDRDAAAVVLNAAKTANVTTTAKADTHFFNVGLIHRF